MDDSLHPPTPFQSRAAARLDEQANSHPADTAARLTLALAAAGLGEWSFDLGELAWRGDARHDQCFGHAGGAWTVEQLLAHFHPEDRNHASERIAEALDARAPLRFEARACCEDGSVHWLEVKGVFTADQRLIGVVADISERKQLAQDLQDAGRKKDEFLAMLAHELRNPLAPISAAAQLLALGHADARMTQKAGAVIDRQARHMNHLLDDLLDTARVTQGVVSLAMRRLDLKHVIAAALEQARPLIEQRRHHLNVQLDPCAAWVTGDEERLIQVLVNLLNNAAKYTPEGGLISVRLDCEDGRAYVQVSDNGVGMDAATAANAFDLFTQGARSSDRSAGGLGLGLALVKNLVERHAGQVFAHSEGKGYGSSFKIILPLLEEKRHASRDPVFDAPAVDSDAAAPSGHGLRILIVDDNRDACEMLGIVLGNAGHQVDLAFTAGAAIERAQQHWPQVFLLDVGLPDMNGYELARHLRLQQPQAANTLMIAITGYGSPADRAHSAAAGIDHHLTKPVDPAELEKLLASVSG